MAEDNVEVEVAKVEVDVEQEVETEVEDQVQEGPTPEELEEAKQFGWVPKEEFRGNEDDWRDADAFLAKGREINGFLRNDLAKIRAALGTKDSELAEMRDTMKEFKEYHKKVSENSYKKALAELKQKKVEAIELQDGQAVVQIDDTINELTEEFKSSQVEAAKPQPKPDSREFEEWATDNEWYKTKPELKAVAELYGEALLANDPSLKGREFLDLVTKQVKQRFPEEFSNPARRQASVASTGEVGGNSRSSKKGFKDLPAEAKQACLKFEKQGLLTKEQYLAEYDWD